MMYKLSTNAFIPKPIGEATDALVSLIALNGLELLATSQLNNIQRCANPDCVHLFINTHGIRKWCSMKICGNRTKVTKHQQRKQKEQQ
ncbi:CGNR zinc finger domain-containing protein [Virgibacillus sp. W0430]|uniref:CGNR zinc finger domain-containing protein n=1 Tax=Virgibacillus sp. W0430 TaxID=3391580 RepID=UPI003F482DCF